MTLHLYLYTGSGHRNRYRLSPQGEGQDEMFEHIMNAVQREDVSEVVWGLAPAALPAFRVVAKCHNCEVIV